MLSDVRAPIVSRLGRRFTQLHSLRVSDIPAMKQFSIPVVADGNLNGLTDVLHLRR